jgi:hypothetical protein
MSWSSDSDENNAKLMEINDQLKIYYKSTDFFEEQLQTLYLQWTQAKKFNRPGRASRIHTRLVETLDRYNHLIRNGKKYLTEIRFLYPEVFDTNIDEFRIRDGWYDEFIPREEEDDD